MVRGHTIFAHQAPRLEQLIAISAFEQLVLDDPELARQALSLGNTALHETQKGALGAAQFTVNRLFETRADLEIRPQPGQDLESNTEYSMALLQWRIANWAHTENRAQEYVLDNQRRRIRLGLILDATSIPQATPLVLLQAA